MFRPCIGSSMNFVQPHPAVVYRNSGGANSLLLFGLQIALQMGFGN